MQQAQLQFELSLAQFSQSLLDTLTIIISSGYDHIKAVIGSVSFLRKNLNVDFPNETFS